MMFYGSSFNLLQSGLQIHKVEEKVDEILPSLLEQLPTTSKVSIIISIISCLAIMA